MLVRSVFALGLSASGLAAQEDSSPLSAIDWLSRSVAPVVEPQNVQTDEAPVSGSGASPNVTTTSLDIQSADTIGLLPPDVTGFPRGIWAGTDQDVLIPLIQGAGVENLPALQDLLMSLLLAEADPPGGDQGDAALFLARVDKLLDMGALEPAQALLEAAGADNPALYRRWFDISLLTGTEDTACAVQQRQPRLAPTYPARIFCMARNGDWSAAALTLNSARALGHITEEEEALLSRFLDPELFEGEPDLPPPSRPSPLVFRMREAIGQGLPTASLPRAFAHADLRSTVPWRYQMQAAERLIRTGAVNDNTLLGFYTARTPAASGGVWDRADAVQEFDAAIQRLDIAAIADTLPTVWDVMERMRTEMFLSRLYGAALNDLELTSEPARIAYRVWLLTPNQGEPLSGLGPVTREERFWQAVAQNDLGALSPLGRQETAVHAGLTTATPPDALQRMIDAGQTGEVLLRIIAMFEQGLAGDTSSVVDALAGLVALDMEKTARRAALQYLILDRPT